MNFNQMASEIGFEKEDFLELAEMLVETSLSDLKDFKEAVDTGKLSKAAMAVHSIKGAAANLGFDEMAKAAEMLEKSAQKKDLSEMAPQMAFIEEQIQMIAKELNL